MLAIFFNDGDEIPVLTNVMVIGAEGESVDAFRPGGEVAAEAAPAASVEESSVAPVVAAAAPAALQTPGCGVSPRARALAAEKGINLANVAGSGPAGRIIERDVVAAADSVAKMTPLAKAIALETGAVAPKCGSGLAGTARGVDMVAPSTTAAVADDSVVKPISNMRKLIAKAMHASL